MAKKSNIAMIAIPVVLAAAGLYFIFRKKKPEDKPKIDDPKPDKIVVEGKEQLINFPLRKGSKGDLVTQLQVALMQLNTKLPTGWDDGKFGKLTEDELFRVTKKKMVESQAELDSIVKIAQNFAKYRGKVMFGIKVPEVITPDIYTSVKKLGY